MGSLFEAEVGVEAFAPGRVNLIGDHTDYTGGLVLPMAIGLGTTVAMRTDPGSRTVRLRSRDETGEASAEVGPGAGRPAGPARDEPSFQRYVEAGVRAARPPAGGAGWISTSLPIGAGLSSSSALTVAVAVALGLPTRAEGDVLDSARRCHEAEQIASGVPGGIMDQLISLAGVAGHALLVDCTTLALRPVPIPEAAQVAVAHCGEPRRLSDSAYARRRAECDAAREVVGPLALADARSVEAIADPVLRRRARHVVSENARVRATAAALAEGDLVTAGKLMSESHASLAGDFEVSTPALDSLVAILDAMPGVFGARLTGAGFGGCAVALAARGAFDPGSVDFQCWLVDAGEGAWRRVADGRRQFGSRTS